MKMLWDFFAPTDRFLKRYVDVEHLKLLMEVHRASSLGDLSPRLQADPEKSLQLLMDLNKSNLALKIHKYHISETPNALESILDLPFVEVVILRRKDTLKQYVSYLKALDVNAWDVVDTTDIKVKVDPSSYASFTISVQNWYDKIKERCFLVGKDLLELEYETHLENLNSNQQNLVSTIEPWFERNGIEVVRSGYVPRTIRRQDASSLQESIINWNEVRYLKP